MWDFKLKSFLHDLKNQTDKPLIKRKMCDIDGCGETGEYRAPKSPDSLDDYYWFCMDHVREYNANWDYFKDKSQAEMQHQMNQTVTWDRPTWRMSKAGINENIIREKIYAHFKEEGVFQSFSIGEDANDATAHINIDLLPQPTADALALMDLTPPLNWEDIKTRYKQLAMKYHPDTNHGDKEAEEKFKKLTLSYNILKLSYNKYLNLEDT